MFTESKVGYWSLLESDVQYPTTCSLTLKFTLISATRAIMSGGLPHKYCWGRDLAGAQITRYSSQVSPWEVLFPVEQIAHGGPLFSQSKKACMVFTRRSSKPMISVLLPGLGELKFWQFNCDYNSTHFSKKWKMTCAPIFLPSCLYSDFSNIWKGLIFQKCPMAVQLPLNTISTPWHGLHNAPQKLPHTRCAPHCGILP